MRGMIRLFNDTPKQTHDLNSHINHLPSILSTNNLAHMVIAGAQNWNGDGYCVTLHKQCLHLCRADDSTLTLLGSSPILKDAELGRMDIALQLTDNSVVVFVGEEQLLSCTDSSYHGYTDMTSVMCKFSEPPANLRQVKKIVKSLGASRNPALYGEYDFSMEDAEDAVGSMNDALRALSNFVKIEHYPQATSETNDWGQEIMNEISKKALSWLRPL